MGIKANSASMKLLTELKEQKAVKVSVRPGSKQESISYDKNKGYIIRLKEKAEKSKANKELIRIMSKLLKENVRIKSGLSSRDKVLVIGKQKA